MSREKQLRVAAKERGAYSEEQWEALVAFDMAQTALGSHLGRYNCLHLSDRGAHSTDQEARAEHDRLIEARDESRAKAAAADPRNTR